MNLPSEWKMTGTQEKPSVAKIIEYSRNALSANKEVLLKTTLVKIVDDKTDDSFVKKLYASTKKLMAQNRCQYEDIQHIPPTAGKNNEWGIYFECAQNKRTGFMFFIDADPTTMYSLTYKADQSYPLTAANRQTMHEVLKQISLCYEGKTCVALVH
jgi:hypothetical protein